MNKQQFDQIYPTKLTPTQHQVLEAFLQGKYDSQIAEIIGKINRKTKQKEPVTESAVRHNIKNICNAFGFTNAKGEHKKLRNFLIQLFVKHKPELVCEKYLLDETQSFPPNIQLSEQLPTGLLLVDSPNYIQRQNIENDCYSYITRSASLIRIKAPHQMGKTSLMNRILEYGETQQYKTICLDFDLADAEVFSDYKNFAQWFLINVTDLLDKENRLDDFWKENTIGINMNMSNYFEKYLLPESEQIILLALENIDNIFEKLQKSEDFCAFLRGFNNYAKRNDRRGKIFQKIKFILVHSTDFYATLNIDRSPLKGVGYIPKLEEFTLEETQQLAQQYQLQLPLTQIEELRSIIGGHPYLLTLVFEYLQKNQSSWLDLLTKISTEESILIAHLRENINILNQNEALKTAYQNILQSHQSVSVTPPYGFQLESMGLVKPDGNGFIPRYKLYREYFSRVLGVNNNE